MKVFLADQAQNFGKLLTALTLEPVMEFDKSALKEKITSIRISSTKRIGDLNLDFFFDYQVFPSTILTFLAQWSHENRKMKVGDTILQQVFLPPIHTLSMKAVFGVRVNRIIDEPVRKGYSYQTLRGHAERGESVFTVEEDSNGLLFRIQTFSEPGNILTRMTGPFFTVPYQAYCTKRALENVKEQIEEQSF